MLPNEILGLPSTVALLLAASALLLPTLLAFLIAQQAEPRAKLRARMSAIATNDARAMTPKAAQDRAKRVKTKLRETGHAGHGKAVELRLQIERAGLTISNRNFYLVSGTLGLAGAVLYLILGFAPLVSPAVIAVCGVALPRLFLSVRAGRRQQEFTRRFADAIDVIVRGVRSGLPIGECMGVIAREAAEPVASEFTLIVEGQRLGMTLKQALDRACRRMPTADMKFFAVVLNLQQQTGGNLAETLSGLSNLLRGRKKMADKIRAMSAEARMTASIIGVLPFLISGVIYVISPGYMMLLWTDPLGNVILYGGLGVMAVGVFIMKQMISFEI